MEIQEEERCAKDFDYFCKTYCKAVMYCELHKDHGLFIHFELYDYQKRYFEFLEKNQFVITNTFRTSGLTTFNQFYLFWKCLFNSNQHCMSIFKTDRECRWNGSQVIHDAYRYDLPEWIKEKIEKQNDHTIEFKNGSVLNFFRSDVALTRFRPHTTYIVLDGVAFWGEDPNILLYQVSQVCPTAKCSIISGANSVENNVFCNMYYEAVQNYSIYKNFEIHYSENEHVSNFIEYRKTGLGEIGFKIEMENYFCTNDKVLIHPLKPTIETFKLSPTNDASI